MKYVVTNVRKEWSNQGTRHEHIEGVCTSGGAHYTWTPSAVQTISLSITSHDGQAIDGAAQAKDLFLPSISATVGDSGQAWAQDQIGAAACGKGCSQVMAGGEITVTAGLLGFQQLDVVAVAGGQP